MGYCRSERAARDADAGLATDAATRACARVRARGVPNRSDLRLELDVEKLVAGGCHLAEQDNLVLELFRVHGLRPQLADQAVEVRHVSWAVVWGYKQT